MVWQEGRLPSSPHPLPSPQSWRQASGGDLYKNSVLLQKYKLMLPVLRNIKHSKTYKD